MQYWHSDIKQSQACLSIQVGGLVTSFSMVVCKTFYAYESFVFLIFDQQALGHRFTPLCSIVWLYWLLAADSTT